MPELSKSKKMFLLFGVSLLSFTGFLDATIVSTALPDIQSSLKMSVTELQWIMNAFFLGISAFMASMGRVGDIYGRRKVFYLGTLVFGLASMGAGLATTPGFLILCRAVQGITTAITIPVGIALVQAAHDKKEIAKAMSIFGSITGAGLALGPVIGGTLVTAFGWPAVFFVNIPFIIVGFALCCVGVKESRSNAKMSLDYLGIIFLTLTIAPLVFGMTQANLLGWNSELVIASLATSAIALIILILVERNAKHPILAGYLFKNRIFVACILFAFVGGSAMNVVLFIDPLYLHIILEQTNFITGLMLFIIPIAVISTAYAIGYLHHIMGARKLMIFASLAYLTMAILHMAFGISLAYSIIIPAFALMGLAWGIANTTPGTALGENIHGDHIGVAIGALFSFYNIGAAVTLAFSVVIFHIRTASSFIYQFSKHNLNFNDADKNYLQQFINQPDQLHQIASKLNVNSTVASDILKQAFVSGLHAMFLPIILLSIISLLGLIFIMNKKTTHR